MPTHTLQSLLDESGKTKNIFSISGYPDLGAFRAKIRVTAGDGARAEDMKGKDVLSTTTTCNVFRFLQSHSEVPLAFVEQHDPTTFIARLCDMLLFEVVVRRRVHEEGSFVKRYPHEANRTFTKPIVEFFLKTKNKEWKGHPLPKDDPFMVVREEAREVDLYRPDLPMADQKPFLTLPFEELPGIGLRRGMEYFAIQAFLTLEEGFGPLNGQLDDYKVEFGMHHGRLLMADVIDNDSWRLWINGVMVDKQRFRRGESAAEVRPYYVQVAAITQYLGFG